MKFGLVIMGVVFACVGVTAAIAIGSHAPGSSVLVSERFAAMGNAVSSPQGPYVARPTRVTFDEQGRNDGLWVVDLVWVDWGHDAHAYGVVHARKWPGTRFDETTGRRVARQRARVQGPRLLHLGWAANVQKHPRSDEPQDDHFGGYGRRP